MYHNFSLYCDGSRLSRFIVALQYQIYLSNTAFFHFTAYFPWLLATFESSSTELLMERTEETLRSEQLSRVASEKSWTGSPRRLNLGSCSSHLEASGHEQHVGGAVPLSTIDMELLGNVLYNFATEKWGARRLGYSYKGVGGVRLIDKN